MGDEVLSITHLVGLEVVIAGQYHRQRCAWCDEILVDEDASLVAVPIGQTWTPFWPVGALVRVAGPVSQVIEPDVREGTPQTPEDACWISYLLDPDEAKIVPMKPH